MKTVSKSRVKDFSSLNQPRYSLYIHFCLYICLFTVKVHFSYETNAMSKAWNGNCVLDPTVSGKMHWGLSEIYYCKCKLRILMQNKNFKFLLFFPPAPLHRIRWSQCQIFNIQLFTLFAFQTCLPLQLALQRGSNGS